MSLEEAVKENTAAIRELIAALKNNAAPVKAAPAQASAPKPAAPPAASPVSAAPASAAGTVITDDDIRKEMNPIIARIGRDKVAEILKKYGAEKAINVPQERRAEFLAEAKKAVAK